MGSVTLKVVARAPSDISLVGVALLGFLSRVISGCTLTSRGVGCAGACSGGTGGLVQAGI